MAEDLRPSFPERNNNTNLEKSPRHRIGIFNETDPLRAAAVWGPVGSEAVLAQLYPQDISLFFDSMNVVRSRQEAEEFATMLNSRGVQTINIRDEIANLLPADNLEHKYVFDALIQKARNIQKEFPQNHPRPDIEPAIETLFYLDIERYGEERAANLNALLCLLSQFPLGNLIYTRDPMNVLGSVRIRASMAKPIRQPEVVLSEIVYRSVLEERSRVVSISEGETFEGGDAYIHNGIVYVGVGVRTTRGAAMDIFNALYSDLISHNLQFAIVEDPDPASRPQEEQMDFMHLDTFSAAIGHNQIAVCEEEAEKRRVSFLTRSADGIIVISPTGESFLKHLQGREKDIIIIPREEQRAFGCNFLALDENTILMPLDSNTETIAQLRRLGKELIFVDLYENTRGYGAAHCMIGQIQRNK